MKVKATSVLVLGIVVLAAALALPAVAHDRVPAGLDYWQTLSGGATRYSFASDPLPAGFLCAGAPAFRGDVYFEGVPLASEPAGILGTTDTIIERLDDGVFDESGRTVVRIRARALNLIGSQPLATACGNWKVTAGLTGRQPVREMVFQREHRYGGTFDTNLALRVEIRLTHTTSGVVRKVERVVELPTVRSVPYAALPVNANWSAQPAPNSPSQPISPQPVACASIEDPVSHVDASHADRPRFSGPVRLLDDGVVGNNPRTLQLGSAPSAATAVATGCLCSPQGQCLPVYSWHDPCATNPNCELHFTHTPCELGYRDQCDDPVVIENYAIQLRELYDRGYLIERPEQVLQRQLGRVRDDRPDGAAPQASSVDNPSQAPMPDDRPSLQRPPRDH